VLHNIGGDLDSLGDRQAQATQLRALECLLAGQLASHASCSTLLRNLLPVCLALVLQLWSRPHSWRLLPLSALLRHLSMMLWTP
jgi:hypothetical protein